MYSLDFILLTNLVIRYRLTVVTGDYWNAGTNANVFVTLYGEHGDTGIYHFGHTLYGHCPLLVLYYPNCYVHRHIYECPYF